MESIFNSMADNKYFVKALYNEMIQKYEAIGEGGVTKFGIIITPKFINALKTRYKQLTKRIYI